MAERLGVPHRTTQIPWGEDPFPKKPHENEPIEEIARAARQNRLLNSLRLVQAPCIAFGHHADDQVETAIMRIMKGSGEFGIAGMQPVRRWGMGTDTGLEAAGLAGMNHWIIRPLLTIPKRLMDPAKSDDNRPLTVKEQTTQKAIKKLSQYAGGDCSLPGLREAVYQAGCSIDQTEQQASDALDKCTLPSPPSTLLLSHPHLLSITDPLVRHALVRRVLRCVSPRPWGAPSAVASGSRAKLDRFAQRIWDAPRTESEANSAFSLGARVRWQPAVVRADGAVRMDRAPQHGEYGAWLVVREPPWSPGRVMSENEPRDATADYTDKILEAKDRDARTVQLLYDARFCIEIAVDDMPEDVSESLIDRVSQGRIIVKPDTKWWLPKVVWQREFLPDQVLAQYAFADEKNQQWTVDRPPLKLVAVPWVQMSFIRPLSAL
ncbi:hypothetical protein EIP86_010798 [Pleurotus ostreatoroseus]|nr:hypothetical protein EIP86_010798 [Pleurotus ostreatoroseus]